MNVSRHLLAAAAAVLALAHRPAVQAAPDEQFIPVNFTSDGPSAKASAAMAAGLIDYLRMLNARDGGVHGVRFAWERCDNGYDSSRSIECYERAKARTPGATLVNPQSTAATYSLIERASADRVPLVSAGYGRADSADGRVFPYVFPLVTTQWNQAAAVVRYLGMRAGGMEKLRGKRIVLLYSDTADGKDVIPVLSALATKYGYTLATLAVAPPGTAQDEPWMKMRQIRPDWLIVWGSESMSAAALESAQRAGFPRERMLGGATAAGAAEASGAAAQGFVAAVFSVPGDDPAPIRDIRRFVYERGHGELTDASQLGSLSYNRGVVFGILTAEAVRVAQEHFKPGKPVSAQQAQWGLEHLSLDSARLEELGASELMPPVETSCADHEGSGYMRFVRWDGERWRALTDWMAPVGADRAAVLRMYAESASAYAMGKGIQPKSCAAG